MVMIKEGQENKGEREREREGRCYFMSCDKSWNCASFFANIKTHFFQKVMLGGKSTLISCTLSYIQIQSHCQKLFLSRQGFLFTLNVFKYFHNLSVCIFYKTE